MDEKTAKRINALQCAVRVLDGTAGGYQKHELDDAKLELMNLIAELERQK